MKKLLIMSILVSCITLTACGPGTSEVYIFESFDELVTELKGKFMLPTYYPEGFDTSNNNIRPWKGIDSTKGYYIDKKEEGDEKDVYYIECVSVIFYDYETVIYDREMHLLLINRMTDIKYYNDEKVFISERSDRDENITNVNNLYLIYKDYIPYCFYIYVILFTTNETEVTRLLPEINEMTYTEAMKMFDSLQPIE